MAYSLNKVQIIGNVGKDPEVRNLNNGDLVANLRVATTERWTDKSSQQQKENTEWHSCVIFGKTAEIIQKYVKKGSKIFLEGKLVTRKWQDNSGTDRYTTEIQINGFNGQVILLDSKGGNSGGGGQQPQAQKPQQQQNNSGNNTGFPSFGGDVPFS
jgi:single-strand DNA-binding protein